MLIPDENIVTMKYGAQVVKEELKSSLLDGDTQNYDLDHGFSRHPIEDDCRSGLQVKLGQPSIINHIRLLLWDRDSRCVSDHSTLPHVVSVIPITRRFFVYYPLLSSPAHSGLLVSSALLSLCSAARLTPVFLLSLLAGRTPTTLRSPWMSWIGSASSIIPFSTVAPGRSSTSLRGFAGKCPAGYDFVFVFPEGAEMIELWSVDGGSVEDLSDVRSMEIMWRIYLRSMGGSVEGL